MLIQNARQDKNAILQRLLMLVLPIAGQQLQEEGLATEGMHGIEILVEI